MPIWLEESLRWLVREEPRPLTSPITQIMRVDKVFKGLEGEMARLQEMGSIAAKLAKAPNGPQRNALIEEAIRTLESPGFGDEAAADAYKKSDEYKSFVEANRVRTRHPFMSVPNALWLTMDALHTDRCSQNRRGNGP